jgi:uncharacterized protein (UPF0264 family)
MTKWLASVQSLAEAQSLTEVLPDILDMKQPAEGALGQLDPQIVAEIVHWVNKRCQTSATVGDLPMRAELIAAALKNMAQTGVDYLKVGLFDDANLADCIASLAPTIAGLNTPVIAVMFADQQPKIDLIPQLKAAGFAGVMVDTAIKNGHSLTDIWTPQQRQQFVSAVKQQQMLCGLAGALKIDDIALLAPLGADYLGFRSALCANHQRNQTVQHSLAQRIAKQLLIPVKLAG